MSYLNLENKKVLVTGGAGFIGSHVVDKLLENKAQVVVLDNLSSGKLSNLPDNKIKFYQANIENPQIDEIFKVEKPNYVIHLAAQTSVANSVSNPEFDAKMNILGSINVLKACKKYNVKKIIAASSAAVYGDPQYLPIDENHPTIPMSPYGVSKLAMERYIKLSGVPYVIFRFSNAYGPRQQSSKESGVIAIFNDAMLNNKPINIYGDGEQLRDFVYVEDIASVCVAALKSEIKNEIFNFSTNKGITINQVFDEMKHAYGYEPDANYLPEREGEIRDSILSNRKFIDRFDGFKTVSILDGIPKLRNSNLPKISILMACYNSEMYLNSSIGSVLNQIYQNWELICINDASSDNTLSILFEYAKQDSRIKVIDSKNWAGAAAPNRNMGLNVATGEFVIILDSDDEYSPDLLEKLVKRQLQTGADIVIPDCKFVYQNDSRKNWTIAGILNSWGKNEESPDRTQVLSPFEAVNYSLDWRIHGFNLIKTSIVKKVRFCEFGINGDEYSVREFYLNANKIVFSEGTYFYNQIETSITKKLSSKKFDVFRTPYLLEKLLIKNKFPLKRIKEIRKSRIALYNSLLEQYKANIDSFSISERHDIEALLSQNLNLLKEPKIPFFYKGLKLGVKNYAKNS